TFGKDFTYSGTTLTVPNVQGDLGIYVMPGVDPENLCTFVPLTDVAMLEEGQQVIIVYPQTPAVASKTLTNTYLSNETSGFTVKTDGSIEVPKTSSTIGIFTLGGSTGAWTLTNSAGQKLSAGESTLSWNGTNSTWTIEVNSSGNTVMKAAGSYQLYYNSSSPRFKTYSSPQASIKLYITFSGDKKANSLTFDKTGAQSIKVGSTLKNSAKAQYGTVTYSSSAADVATVDKSGLVTALAAGSTTITATVEEGAYYQEATASYILTVNPLDVYTITWMNGESQFATTSVTEGETLVLPSTTPSACSNGQVFVGWTTADNKAYFNETTPPAFVSAGEEVTANTTYYAVFAAKEEGASGENTCSQTSFSATSGNLDGDRNISFTAEKGSAGTAPVINNNELRIYQGGGLLTVTANNGKAIRSLTLRSSQATKIQYKAGDGSFSSIRDVTANKEYTISNGGTDVAGGTSTIIVIKNAGTSSSNRLNVNMLSVTYTGGNTTTYTYYSAGCGSFTIKNKPELKFDTTNVALVIGETFTNKLTTNSTGAVTYTSSDAAVASVDNAGLVQALKAGKATITASVAETDTYKAAVATYSVSVQKKEVVAWFEGNITTLTKQDNDAPFLLTVSTNSDGAVTYSSEDPTVATIDYNSGRVTPLKAGTTTITASVAETETFRSKNVTCVLTIIKTNECKVVWIVSEVVLTEYGSTLTVSGEGSATLETMPPAPHNADCAVPNAVFLGWSTTNVGKVLKAGEAAPADLFTKLNTAPAISS
ncbi:MAG: Ig domain-containing protein, partial [Paludibacteraceae bacterium]